MPSASTPCGPPPTRLRFRVVVPFLPGSEGSKWSRAMLPACGAGYPPHRLRICRSCPHGYAPRSAHAGQQVAALAALQIERLPNQMTNALIRDLHGRFHIHLTGLAAQPNQGAESLLATRFQLDPEALYLGFADAIHDSSPWRRWVRSGLQSLKDFFRPLAIPQVGVKKTQEKRSLAADAGK